MRVVLIVLDLKDLGAVVREVVVVLDLGAVALEGSLLLESSERGRSPTDRKLREKEREREREVSFGI